VANSFIDTADNEGSGKQVRKAKPDAKLITISSVELNEKSNYQDFQRFQPVDFGMVGDAEASLPSLIEAVKSAMRSDLKVAYEKRGVAFRQARKMEAAAVGWDASPISTARLSAELWAAVKDLDWSLVASRGNVSGWPQRLWKLEKHYQWLGGLDGARPLTALPPRLHRGQSSRLLNGHNYIISGDNGYLMPARRGEPET
jgi:acetolactate synthase I/II/III large subunit